MLRAALAGDPRAIVWTDEIDRAARAAIKADTVPEPSYMVDTLRRLRSLLDSGGEGPRHALRLLIGADQAIALHRWRDYREVMRLAPPIVWLRSPVDTAEQLLAALFDVGVWSREELAEWRTRIAPLPLLDLSATAVRERLKTAPSTLDDPFLRRALPIRVLEYISQNNLYR